MVVALRSRRRPGKVPTSRVPAESDQAVADVVNSRCARRAERPVWSQGNEARPGLRDATDERPLTVEQDCRRPADLPVGKAAWVARHRASLTPHQTHDGG